MKKIIGLGLSVLMTAAALAGCGGNGGAATSTAGDSSANAATTKNDSITVVSREDGSGTRGAFIELFGIEEKDADGNKVDHTTENAEITNSTAVMLASIQGNQSGIGYVSLGSMNDTVKAVKIDGAEATTDNIKNGSYTVSRPFNIATKDDVSEVAQDFIDYILSADGQKVVEDNGYISQENTGDFTTSSAEGSIVIAGSSSVTPVMEKLKEAYLAVNDKAKIDIQESDSTTGMTSAIEGVCVIGMASRELSEEETGKGLKSQVIALDGIAVIVNQENTVDELTHDQVKSIFTGETTEWSKLAQ